MLLNAKRAVFQQYLGWEQVNKQLIIMSTVSRGDIRDGLLVGIVQIPKFQQVFTAGRAKSTKYKLDVILM